MKLLTAQEQYERYQNIIIPEYLIDLDSLNINKKLISFQGLYSGYKLLGILEWYLHKDAIKFKKYLKMAIQYDHEWYINTLPQRPDNKYDTPIQPVFDALNTGDWNFAAEYIRCNSFQ